MSDGDKIAAAMMACEVYRRRASLSDRAATTSTGQQMSGPVAAMAAQADIPGALWGYYQDFLARMQGDSK